MLSFPALEIDWIDYVLLTKNQREREGSKAYLHIFNWCRGGNLIFPASTRQSSPLHPNKLMRRISINSQDSVTHIFPREKKETTTHLPVVVFHHVPNHPYANDFPLFLSPLKKYPTRN